MTDRSALVRGIAHRPADDTRRLVTADWFEENGHPERAAFSRHQVAAARLPQWSAARLAHEDAADLLLSRHRAAWLGPWATRLAGCEFRRGFVRNARVGIGE